MAKPAAQSHLPPPEANSFRHMAPTLPVIAIFALVAIFTAFNLVFPSPFDELGHLSVIRTQWEHPDLLADTRTYRMLSAADPALMTDAPNYINHPALYYWLMSLLPGHGQDIILLRLVNTGLAVFALAWIVWAGCRILRTAIERVLFALTAASFPKFALIGGMINNDNLAMVAAAAVFAGLTGTPFAGWLVAGGLALAGWTKLTALIALAAAVGIKTLLDGRDAIWHRNTLLAGCGAIAGAFPFLYNYVQSGELFHVNLTVNKLPPSQWPKWDFFQYAGDFFQTMAIKWPAAEASVAPWAGALLVAVPLGLCIFGTARNARLRNAGLAYLIAIAITFAFHLGFGWRSFVTIGDTTIPQTRYYNILWPGLSLAAAYALSALRPIPRTLGIVALLAPTVIGGVVLELFLGA